MDIRRRRELNERSLRHRSVAHSVLLVIAHGPIAELSATLVATDTAGQVAGSIPRLLGES